MMHRRLKQLIISLAVLPALGLTTVVQASDNAAGLRFENHRFTPQTLSVLADQPLTISVVNASKETIEFESFKLNREKVIGPGETITVRIPALSPGTYDFYDDFHQDVPEGTVVAK
jgi:hypothetical protein